VNVWTGGLVDSMSELHLRLVLKVWVTHYNGARPHMALGLGVPDPPLATVRASTQLSRHQIGARLVLRVKSILAGLHHEYSLAPALG
jgi:putative transposase